MITLSVDEKDIVQLAVGQSVNVTVQVLNKTTLNDTGRLTTGGSDGNFAGRGGG